jgi:hypothetical protein
MPETLVSIRGGLMDIANLKRYNPVAMRSWSGIYYGECMPISHGEFVKFNDVKELIEHATNTASPKLPLIEDVFKFVNDQYAGGASVSRLQGAELAYRYFERQLRAGA